MRRVGLVECSACGEANEASRKFCAECGAPLTRACAACGTANAPAAKFCGECGHGTRRLSRASRPRVAVAAPQAERRLVSVLFADLVGFTAASESRDAEDTRELLSRYFDTCRRLIELYGGTVEKFIGDAVMAVWGTPVATEDDAERAVRAALDLVAAVSALGDEVGAPELRARAGVLTGEAAVTIGASGEGMVAGDLVNTASRVQSAAEPGTVFVGESTRRATEQTIVFDVAGSFELKGKEGQTPLWQALRVVSGARGTLKSTGLEAPFVGRDGELRRIKDLFHTSRGRRPRAARLGDRRRGDRQVAARVGVLQVLRRPAAVHVLASRPLSRLRRRRRLLGARRHGADALPDRRGRGARLRAREAARGARGASLRSGGAGLRRAAARTAPRAGRAATAPTDRTCSRPGGCSSSASRRSTPPCSRSRTCSGRTRACSTSSSTCSTGRGTIRST